MGRRGRLVEGRGRRAAMRWRADARPLPQQVPLEALAAELTAYAGRLKGKVGERERVAGWGQGAASTDDPANPPFPSTSQLVEVLNDDYDDFIALSTDLADVDGAVAGLRPPLRRLRRALAAAAAAVDAARGDLATALADRDGAVAARRRLKTVRDAVAAADRVDALLASVGAGDDGAATPSSLASRSLDDTTRALERAAAEVARLTAAAAAGARGAPLVAALAPRAEAARAALARALDAALAASLDAGDAGAAVHVMQSFAALGDGDGGAAACRRAAFDSAVVAALGPAPVEPSKLPAALTAARAAIEARAGALLRAAADPAAGLSGLPLLPAAVAALADALATTCPAAFSPGRPDDFVAGYRAATAFAAGLDAAYGGGGAPTAAAAAASLLLPRWSLPAYAGLRVRDAAAALEAALADPGVPAAVAGGGGDPAPPLLRTRAAAGAASALAAAASPASSLPPVADRFLRLALQASSRYSGWLAGGCADRAAAAESGDARAAPDAAPATPPPSTHWAATASLPDLLAAAADAGALAAWARGPFAAALAAAAGGGPAAAPATAGAARAVSKFEAAEAEALAAAAAVAAAGAAPHLAQLRGVVATFRMTARPAPTSPSPYAAACLGGIGALVGPPAAGGLEQLTAPAAAAFAALAVSRVASQFAAVASDVLGALRRTESSLRRLKGRAGGVAAAAGGPTDADKIAAQVALDAASFREAAARAGVDVGGDAGFLALEAVARGEGEGAAAPAPAGGSGGAGL